MILEQVKEHFKNAKEVKCLDDNKVYEIKNIEFINYDEYLCSFWYKENIELVDENGKFAKIISYKYEEKDIKTPTHYNNENGTLYKIATQRNWNAYLFDIVKRLERANKKGEFENDLNKSIAVIQLWLKESKNDN